MAITRRSLNRNAAPSAGIIDSQSVPTTESGSPRGALYPQYSGVNYGARLEGWGFAPRLLPILRDGHSVAASG